MSKARHGFKSGGAPMINSGRESAVEDKMEAGHKSGGAVKRAKGGMVDDSSMMPKKRMDRPGRKRGGGVGADRTPLSSANKTSGGHSGTMSGEAGC